MLIDCLPQSISGDIFPVPLYTYDTPSHPATEIVFAAMSVVVSLFFLLVFCLFDDATQLQFTRSSQYTLPVQFYSFELAAYMPFGYLISVYMGKAPRIWIKPKGHRARIYSGRVVQRRPTSCNCSNSIWVHYNTNTHTFLYIPHIIRYVMCNINVNLVLVFTIQFMLLYIVSLCWYFSSFTINLACSIACTSKYCTDLCYLLVCSWMDLL